MQDRNAASPSLASLAGMLQQETAYTRDGMTPAPTGAAEASNPTLGYVVPVLAAHLAMLQDQGVIDGHGYDALARGLDSAQTALSGGGALPLRGMIDALVARVDGQSPPELAGASTLGLAREEWLATAVRLAWRTTLDQVLVEVGLLRDALVELAETHVVTIMPAFAGSRAMQPTNFGHLLGGVIVPLRSATRRLLAARNAIDRSPLGAGMLAGEFLALDREQQAALLGFAAPVGNTLDAVMSVEDVIEGADAIAATVAPVRRLLRELASWMRSDPDSFLLAESWQTQPESVNPLMTFPEPADQLIQRMTEVEDRSRGLVSRLREAPFGPVGALADVLLAAATDLATDSRAVLDGARSLLTEGMTINRAYLGNRSGRAYTTGGDLAGFLMTEEALSPAAARTIAAMVLRQLQEQKLEVSGIQQDMIDSAAMMVIGREIKVEMETLGRFLAPRRYLERRAVLGSPASAPTREWLASERADLDADRQLAKREAARGTAALAALERAIATGAAAVD